MLFNVSYIHIKNYGPIGDLEIGPIPDDCQWIFLTGENGSGKTSILKAISTAIFRGNISLGPRTDIKSKYSIGLILNKNGRKPKYRIEKPLKVERHFEPLTKGFVAFGPMRLNIWEQKAFLDQGANEPDTYFQSPYRPIFLTTSFLLDVSFIYNKKSIWKHSLLKGKEERLNNVNQVISILCESIVDIHFGRYMRYFEVDEDGKSYQNNGSTFLQLASGYRSTIAMISHMMLHLYYQQPDVMDTAKLEGIVLIDEIDLHFHPKMQRHLVEKLTEIFPRVQFIVSTHSPIPLLGAPVNSIIYTVKRNVECGVYVHRMDDKVDFSRILPNAILTSPIFGFDDIVPNSHDINKPISSQDNFNDVVFEDKLLREIEGYLTKAKERKLLTQINK